jgi:hypothetical protein
MCVCFDFQARALGRIVSAREFVKNYDEVVFQFKNDFTPGKLMSIMHTFRVHDFLLHVVVGRAMRVRVHELHELLMSEMGVRECY